ncbi:MAG: NAD(P)H-dependent glycerol-3-phosphate dehydrogenase [Alphaproteobacteria bacterium]
MNVGIIGAGAWGSALSVSVARGGNNVVLWSFDGLYKEFDGVEFPNNIVVSSDVCALSGCDVWLIVTPGAFFRETVKRFNGVYQNQPVIICTKGAEYSTGCFMSEIIKQELPQCKNIGVLSGPQFAAEVASGVLTGSTLAGNDVILLAGRVIFSKLHISESNDVIGAQVCGVGKNIVALICGYMSVKSKGENERAYWLTMAWQDVINVGLAMGADLRTFSDLCGIGDLFLSATSETSRNYFAGVSLARNQEISGTVEGVFALTGFIRRAQDLCVQTPCLTEMKKIMNI